MRGLLFFKKYIIIVFTKKEKYYTIQLRMIIDINMKRNKIWCIEFTIRTKYIRSDYYEYTGNRWR